MKRPFSLALLFACSLTLCAAAHGETWRLTDSPYSDSLPAAVYDNAGRLWVAWLSDSTGDYDVYNKRFNGVSWTNKLTIHADEVDQHRCRIVNDSFTGHICVAWDSTGKVQLDRYAGYWNGVENVVDSIWTLNTFYGAEPTFFLTADDSGRLYIAWSSNDTTVYSSVYLRRYITEQWGQVECVLHGEGLDILYSDHYIPHGMVSKNDYPIVFSEHDHNGHGGHYSDVLGLVYWDSIYSMHYADIATQDNWGFPPSYIRPNAVALARKGDTMIVVYCDTTMADSLSLLSKTIVGHDSLIAYAKNTIYPRKRIVYGVVEYTYKPLLAWSDSHSVFLNTYFDTIWSQPPVRISDTSLHNCINPDIVAENDSTVWVCYQNDGDIYVTRTTVPLGVAGNPNTEYRIPKPITLKAWPNPARNVVHFSYTLPAKRNSAVSIYDVAGRRAAGQNARHLRESGRLELRGPGRAQGGLGRVLRAIDLGRT
ncbi:MAG: hypothetical protein MUF78_07390 [Candidatus Edwardsbacteria bacterium]|nr:hypothetical protein [Candidatus Edwardsbacteria bacterium]